MAEAGEGPRERRGFADALVRAEAGLGTVLGQIAGDAGDLESAVSRVLVLLSNCGPEGEACGRPGPGGDPWEGTNAGRESPPACRPAQFVDAIKSEHPRLNWGRVAAALDSDDFGVVSQGAFVSLMEAFRVASPGGFPLEAVLGLVWKNAKGQLAFLRHAVAAPPGLFEFRPDQTVFPPGVLESGLTGAGTMTHAWVSLDLLETLYMLAKGGHEAEVRQILDHLVRHCKEVLLVALDRMGVPECAIFQEAYRNLVEHFLRQADWPTDCNPEEVCSTVREMVLERAAGQQAADAGEAQGPGCGIGNGMHGCLNEASMQDAPCLSADSARSSTATCSSMQGVSMEASSAELSDMWIGLERSDSGASSTLAGSEMDDAKHSKVKGTRGDDGRDASELGNDCEACISVPPCLGVDRAEPRKGKSRHMGSGRACGGGSLPNKTLREASLLHNMSPSPHIHTLLASVLDDMCGCISLAAKIRNDVHGEDLAWLADSLLAKCLIVLEHPHPGCLALFEALPQIRECTLVSVYHYVGAFLHSSSLKSDSGDQYLLCRLGSWLGHLTLARNRPIRLRDLDLKAVMDEARREDTLPMVLPFLLAVLTPARGSLIFTGENPWIEAILVNVAEIHANGPPCVKSVVEQIMDIFAVDLESLMRRRCNYPCPADRVPVRGAPTAGRGFYGSHPWLVYQATALHPQYNIPQHQAVQVHGVQGSLHSQVNSGSTLPTSSVLPSTWTQHRWREGSSRCLVTGGRPAWRPTGANVDTAGGFYLDKWLHPAPAHGLQGTDAAPSGSHSNNEHPERGGPCPVKKKGTCRSFVAKGQLGKHWTGSGCKGSSEYCRRPADMDRRLAVMRGKGCAEGPSNLAANAAGAEFVEAMAGWKAGDSCREHEVGLSCQLKGMASGDECDDDWGVVHTLHKERCSDASSSSDFEVAGLLVNTQAHSCVRTSKKCGKGRRGGKRKGNNVGGISGHPAPGQEHQCVHSWKQGGGQKPKCHTCHAETCSPGLVHKNKAHDCAGRLSPVGTRPVVTVARKSSKLRGRRIEDRGCWSGNHQLAASWKSGSVAGRVASLTEQRVIRQGARNGPERSDPSKAARKTLGSRLVHRARDLALHPAGTGHCGAHNASQSGHERDEQESSRQSDLWSPGRVHCIEVPSQGVQGGLRPKPARRQGAGRVGSKHLNEPAANGRTGVCASGAVAKGTDVVADKWRHKKRNKKVAGGGRQRHQKAPKADKRVVST